MNTTKPRVRHLARLDWYPNSMSVKHMIWDQAYSQDCHAALAVTEIELPFREWKSSHGRDNAASALSWKNPASVRVCKADMCFMAWLSPQAPGDAFFTSFVYCLNKRPLCGK